VIDLHSHILPGLDDGPATQEAALAMARVAVEAGIRTIVATPHINSSYPVRPQEVPVAVAALNLALVRNELELQVVAGGEIAVPRLLELAPSELEGLRLGRGPYLLIESPLGQSTPHVDTVILNTCSAGYGVVLAHPERAPAYQRDLDRLAALVEAGVLCSITAGSLSGRFGDTVRRFTLRMFAEGLVHNVASDAHDHRRRPPTLLGGFEAAEPDLPGILAQAEWYTERAPAAILAGADLPERPPPPRLRRTGLARMWRAR